MLDLVSIDFFEVGNLPKQIRRNLKINTSGSNVHDLRDVRDGVRDRGRNYFDGPEAKSVFRRMASFDVEGYDPNIILGNTDSGTRYLRGGDRIYRYVAVFEQENPNLRSNSRLQMIVCGYTDRAELDRGKPTLDTVMHINSLLTLRITTRETRGGRMQEEYSVVSNGLVILPDRHSRKNEKFSTPVSFADYVDDYADGHDVEEDSIVVGEDGNTAKVVRHNLSLPDNYFRTLAYADMMGKEDKEATYGGLNMDASRNSFVSSRFKSKGNESSVADNDFVLALKDADLESFEDLRRENAFTLEDIIEVTSSSVREAMSLIEHYPFDVLDYDSERWESARQVTLDVYDLCHRIPELMMNNLIKGCGFRVSNLYSSRSTGRVEPEFQFFQDANAHDEDSYNIETLTANGDVPEFFLDRFEDSFIDEVFIPLTRNGEIPVEITVYSTLSGLTRVEIDYDDEGEIIAFTFGSFLEGRLATHLTKTRSRSFVNTVKEYHNVREEIDTAILQRNAREFEEGFPSSDRSPRRATTTLDDIFSKKSFGRRLLERD